MPNLEFCKADIVAGPVERGTFDFGHSTRRVIVAEYWIDTVTELRGDLIGSGKLDEALVDKFLAYCVTPTGGPRLLLSPRCTAVRAAAKPQHRL
jgi:hypothetical protein